MRSSSRLFVSLALLAATPALGCTTRSGPDRPGPDLTDGGPIADSGLDGGGGSLDSGGADTGVPSSPDGGPGDAGCVSIACEAVEHCYDGIDNDCDDDVDEGCDCAPGSAARCLPGRTNPSLPFCAWGEMLCSSETEFGTWGECMGGGSTDGGTSLYGCRRIGIMGDRGSRGVSNFQAWLETQGAITERFHDVSLVETLSRELLETFDLVIVDWLNQAYDAEESQILADWVRDGGGLMVLSGHDSPPLMTADRHNSLLQAFGLSFDVSTLLTGPATLLPHPTTRNAAGTGTLPPITFEGGRATIVPAALSADIVPIATVPSGQTVGVAGPFGEGRVLLYGDEWIAFDTEWSSMPAIVQFWQNVVEWLAPGDSLGITFCDADAMP